MGTNHIAIRPLTGDALDKAVRLSTIVGWNQQLEDWRMLLRLAPAGAFAAVAGERVIGTAVGIDYGGFAWIAMMLVDPAYRSQGLGRRLLETAIAAVPRNLPVRLDATPLGRPLYEKYGFEQEAMLSRHLRHPSSRDASEPEIRDPSSGVRPLMLTDLQAVIERDREIFGGTRGALLEWALYSAPEYAHIVRGERAIHYCLGRRGRLFDQIGPVVAGREAIAEALVDAALVAAGDRPIAIDAFDSRRAFAAWLESRGFLVERPLVRMRRHAESGPRGIGAAGRPIGEFAILGPEFA